MIKFINKGVRKTELPIPEIREDKKEKEIKTAPEKKNKRTKKSEKAMNEEKMNKAEDIMNNLVDSGHVKVVKKDRGLIERTESSKVVLTEDNRQVLGD